MNDDSQVFYCWLYGCSQLALPCFLRSILHLKLDLHRLQDMMSTNCILNWPLNSLDAAAAVLLYGLHDLIA